MKTPISIVNRGGGKSALAFIAALLLSIAGVGAAEDDEVVSGPVKPVVENQNMHLHWPNFDQLVFQGNGDAKTSEAQLRVRTELQLAELEQACRLNETQKKQIQLAIRGDIRRLLSEASLQRLKFEQRMKAQNPNDQMAFQQVWMEMQLEVQPLQRRVMAGPTTVPTSLFAKALPKILTPEQQQAYQAVIDERQRFRYVASVDSALIQLEESMMLTDEQREALTKLLVAMPPPKQTSQYIHYLILIRLSFLPAEKVEPLFTASQWKVFKPQLDQYRNFRSSWIEAGIIDADDVPLYDAPEKQGEQGKP